MATIPWQTAYAPKVVTAREALAHIQNGSTVFVGSGAAEPVLLTESLAAMAAGFWDIQIFQLAPSRKQLEFATPEMTDHFRYNTLYVGQTGTTADHTPMRLSELPSAIQSGVMPIDVALIQVSPPDALGLCSLGLSVDATKAAMENADLVIAQVNPQAPVTVGDTLVPADGIDWLVEGATPPIELPPPPMDPVALTIGRHIAGLIEDGMTLHFDCGSISAATMRHLDTKKDLGIHTDILTDDMLRLIRSRAVTNRMKTLHKGRAIATMVLGSSALYAWVDKNPYVELLPIDQVNDPYVISQNDKMVAVLSIQEMELTGLPVADTEHAFQMNSLPSSMDFLNGARRSRGGFSILALPSTTPDGSRSRIVARAVVRGVAFDRARVDYVVTEYGVVNLRGLSIRERAIALISIAHPKFRAQLLEDAKRSRYVGAQQTIAPENGCVYPHQYEFWHTFEDGLRVFFRPVKPSDAKRLQRLFYSLPAESIRLRYHGTIKYISDAMAQKLAAVDYSRDMAIVGLVGPPTNPRIVAEGRTMYDPSNNMGEFDILVHSDYRQHGLGTFLANYLNRIAYSRGLSGVYAEVIQDNAATMALLHRAWPTARKTFRAGNYVYTVRFPPADVERPKDSIIVHSGRSGDFTYGDEHPFNPARSRTTLHLIREHGYLNEPWMRVEEPRLVPKERLYESHDPAFVDAIETANDGRQHPGLERFGIGTDDCPAFPGLFDWVRLYCSATITAVDFITEENANVVFNPTGGFHHASRSHAEGFCYLNDAIIAIDMLLARGYRVAYIDIDAHHGNGVQDAYYKDDRVLVASLHESGEHLYPWSGFETEIGEDAGRGFTLNVPLPKGTDDEAYSKVFDRVIVPAVEAFQPTVVVVVVGADTHRNDPLSSLALTNNGMVATMERIRDFAHHLVLLGGGGYDLEATTQAWCRMWAAANRIDSLPDYLLGMGGVFLGGEGLGAADIVDMAYRLHGEEKRTLMRELERIAAFHEEHTLPLIGERAKRGAR
jgi:acetoin utilization deacetylase AcuC-like enzyme/acyl-CoA hydrolase/GNAT superfamily N-acetyltransferase